MGNTSSVDVSSMNDTTFITLPSNYASDLPPHQQSLTSSSLSNIEYSKQDLENINIVKSKLLHYLQVKGQENQVPDHVLNFIIEPLSVENELKGSYLNSDWKITSRMVEIYEFMCFKYVHNSHHCKEEKDYKKLLSVMRAHLATAHANSLNTFDLNTSTISNASSNANTSIAGGNSLNNSLVDESTSPPTISSSISPPTGHSVSEHQQQSLQSISHNVSNTVESESVISSGGAAESVSTAGNVSSPTTDKKLDLSSKRKSQSFSGISQLNLNEIQDNLQSGKSSEIKKTAASSSFTEQSRKVSSPKSPKDEADDKNDSTASKLKRTLSNLKKVPKLKLPELSFSKSPKSSRANSVSSPKDNHSSSALSITSSASTSNLETLDKRASMRSILVDTKSLNQSSHNSHQQDNSEHHQTSEQDKGTKIGLLKKLGSFKKTKSGNNLSQNNSVSNTPLVDPFADEVTSTITTVPDVDRILANTEHDFDDKFKALKSQYIEERKQKREQYHTHNLCFNDHEFMEHENFEHAKAIDDLLAKRVCSGREDVVKNEIDMKRLFSKNDELPSYIKEKLDIISHQRDLSNQLIGIKLLVIDCSCKQSIIRMLSPVKETLEFSNSKTKGYELGLVVGPWLLTYHEDVGLVIPSKIIPPLENILFDLGTLDLSSSLEQLCQELSTTIIEWNTKKFYSKNNSEMPDYLKEVSKLNMTSGSSYDFVMEILSNLGIRLNLSDNPSLQLLFSNIKNNGSSPMVWITDKNEEVVFETHAQLDEYVNNLSKSSNNTIAMYRSLDWELLKSYDRVFWAKHLTTIDSTFDPSFNHETTINCPFKHPYLI
ncbi:hypothetical protein NAEGRDRAFT_56824 [Naegleria gruberi]|uniref:Uncharacterized protein n=1 Tax=Naegleria gruberi TaxID=5762 RepID=D2V1U2_NAEGR|nr:uncharacterized protein NAEGRDRAFT_56824 [Naegleria gruberi]EFC49220.1 hypothetical protein NAEGRDRAFT_56824 [Naegleria gruberi]|eukprot:XP_002681964.1 hypothetical protein NAEGRDRAFT_56824 [Naegleria gruberi strain NEG-M]